ncbi:serine hydrolase domain-containing protein [Litorimonas sp.]|uniref:serine hydrolase domain-containing protein n=1 Tax=Litorimonas sp. TaxID=1892381 RepID=UPI003A8B2DD4
MKIWTSFTAAILLGACSVEAPLRDSKASDTKISEVAAKPLAEYEGLYEYENDTTLIIAAGPDRELLYADINGARYPLRPESKDVFLNAGDIPVEFVRDAKGQIIGYREGPSAEADPKIFKLIDAEEKLPATIWTVRPEDKTGPYQYQAPTEEENGLSVRALEEGSELRVNLSDLTEAIYAGQYPNTHSVLLYDKGDLVFEEYFYEHHQDKPHQLRSATKTLKALLVGIAIDKGYIPSAETPILTYFDDYDLENMDPRKQAMTIGDLLSMSSGLDCNDWDGDSPGNESKMIYSEDWVKFGLDLPMQNEPGKVGYYCSANSAILGRLVEKASGQPLRDFADENLFQPLGFGAYEWDFRPDRSNINNYTQAWLRSRDFLKIGVLIAQNGEWKGRQIVSSEWVKALKAEQSRIGDTPYGYLFWKRYVNFNGQEIQTPQLSGNGGQKVVLLKEGETILVLTAGNYNQSSETNEILINYIFPAIDLKRE